MTPTQLHDIGGRRAWGIWGVAMAVYVLAIFHRSSLGVAGLLAADRFDINATQLAFFTVLQLLVYAGLQVPVGVLLDRFGSRIMLLAGLTLMTAGQFAFAVAANFPLAVAARATIGAGDALIFTSVIRLASVWFLVRQAPLITQLTGLIGQSGAIIAAGPLSFALHAFGWTRTFAACSSIGLFLMVAVAMLIKDSPYAAEGPVRIKMAALARSVRTIWGNPGTRLGMWSHFAAQFSATVFALLWGYPFLVQGQGFSAGQAGALLTVMTVWVMITGLVLARLVNRWPFYRSVIVLSVVGVMAASWAVVLLWPGRAPGPVIVVMVLCTATGGPTSMLGFDLARSFTPQSALGRANGLVNIGGFIASLMTMWAIGVILDLRQPLGVEHYDLGDFKVALSAQYAVWLIGGIQILRYRRKAIAHLERVHPGAVEQLRSGKPFVHPGLDDAEGV